MIQATAPIKRIFLSLTVCATVIISLFAAIDTAFSAPRNRKGYIAAKGIVEGMHGKPIWVEYDKEGKAIRKIGEAHSYPYKDAEVMAVEHYTSYTAQYNDIKSEYDGRYEVLTVAEYNQRVFNNSDGTAYTDKPSLRDNTRSVLVLKQDNLNQHVDLVLLESPIDVNFIEDFTIETNKTKRAVLLDKYGKVVEKADVNIGYLTAFYTPNVALSDPLSTTEGQLNSYHFNPNEDKLWAPIAGAKMSAYFGGEDVSDENGSFSVPWNLISNDISGIYTNNSMRANCTLINLIPPSLLWVHIWS